MKQENRWLAAGLAAALAALPSAVRPAGGVGSGGSGASADKSPAARQGTGTLSTSASLDDSQLRTGVQKLHAANEAEVEMGRLGVQTASNAQVQQFAQQMVHDHARNDQQLTALAASMNVPLIGEGFDEQQGQAQEAMSKVQTKSGAAFDKAFVAQMVKDHEKNAKEVGALAARAREKSQPELAAFLHQTEQAMKGHLAMARQLEKTANATAQSPGGASTGGGTSE